MPLTRCHSWPSHGAATLPAAPAAAMPAAPKPASSEEDSGTNEEEVLAPLDADIIRQQVSQIQQLHAQSNHQHHHRYHHRRHHRHHNGHPRTAAERTIRTQIPLQTTAAAVLPVLVLANGGGEAAVERAADLMSGAAAGGRRRRAGSPVLALDPRKKTTLGRHYYPEGGWGWVVVTCSVVVHLLGHGLQLAWPVMQGPASAKFTVHISHTGIPLPGWSPSSGSS